MADLHPPMSERIPSLSADGYASIADMKAHNKGANCANTVACLRTQLGPDELEALVQSLPPTSQALMRRRLLAVEWIPAQEWAYVLEAVCDHFDRDRAKMIALSREWCRADFNSVYRFFLRFGSPEFILSRTSKVWRTYFDVGELVMTNGRKEGTRHHFSAELRDFAPWPLFTVNLQGFIEEVLVLSGAKATEVRSGTPEIRDNRLSCRYDISYE